MSAGPDHSPVRDMKAMVMAAGLGTRMGPLTASLPKPLVAFSGKPLIDHVLDRLDTAGVPAVVVNVHHMGEKIISHLKGRSSPDILISDEKTRLLDTGGGAKKMLNTLGPGAFLIINSDSVWDDAPGDNALHRLVDAWDDRRMDSLLLLADPDRSIGYAGSGDFSIDKTGGLERADGGSRRAFVNMGAYLIHPRLFENTPEDPFSMNLLWDRARQQKRLFGIVHDGAWMHLGSPDALTQAADYLARTSGGNLKSGGLGSEPE